MKWPAQACKAEYKNNNHYCIAFDLILYNKINEKLVLGLATCSHTDRRIEM